MATLQIIWFALVAVLLIGYAVLDGFDLGVGFWHLFSKGDDERRTMMRSIAPFWDGNEVWLITGGGALFAAFPMVYAAVFSGFYAALMIVLFALIFRAVSFEFRDLEETPRWRGRWDVVFSVCSIVAALIFGVAIGNVLNGVPLDAEGNYREGLLGLLNPYSLLIGVTGLAMIAGHGALYIRLKTDGELALRARKWSNISLFTYVALWFLSGVVSLAIQEQHWVNYTMVPALWSLPVLAAITVLAIPLLNMKGKLVKAFIASSVGIAFNFLLVAAAVYPNLLPANNIAANSLSIFNSSSSQLTLSWMLGIALVGMPIVLGYTIWFYRAFRGKVNLAEDGYDH